MSSKFLKLATLSLIVVAILAAAVAPAMAASLEAGRKPPVPPTPVVTPLSDAEIAGLKFMREEEKLAHDVYVTLYAQWGAATFNSIAASEATHTAQIASLLSKYGIADPAAGNGVGVFTDPALQALYNQLIAQGSVSLSAALNVGGLIEETDIVDIQTRLVGVTHSDITQVYTNLISGSYNHLRGFVKALAGIGVTYTPQILDVATYNSIIGGSSGRGRR